MTDPPLRIEKSVYGGDGLARTAQGEVLLVPFTLPGEVIQRRPETDDEDAVQVLQPSPHRLTPPCVHFGKCGGCQYQMAAYSAQVEIKATILQEILEREGVRELPTIQMCRSDEPWGYRNRVRFRVGKQDDFLEVGYNTRGTSDFLPICMCPIAAPVLWDVAHAMMQIAVERPKAADWLHAAHSIEVSCDESADKVQVHLLCAKSVPKGTGSFETLATALKNQGFPLVSMAASRLHLASGRPKELLASWGAEGLVYRVEQNNFWLTPGTFFQVNRFLIPTMMKLVCGVLEGTLAWDLYAGVGLFSRELARRFKTVIAVEANTSAAATLRRSFAGTEHQCVEETTVAFLRRSVLQRERPEVIVVDPPRAGLGEEVCKLLLVLEPARLVYVSCDPTTLARDLGMLTADRFRILETHMVDLFPQTYHLETVMVLERKGAQAGRS